MVCIYSGGDKMMKKLAFLVLPVVLLLASCSKQELVAPPVDEAVWLGRERGIVVASDFSCDYFVVETMRGYTVMRSWGGSAPFRGSVIYGDLSRWGVQTFYNRSDRYLFNADVRDYWLSYFQAIDQVQNLCSDPFGY